MSVPTKARELIIQLINSGWSFALRHGVDTGDHPYISVEAIKGNRKLIVSWHTRATGTYRLFSCMGRGDRGGMRDLTLTKATDLITDPEVAA